MLIEVHHYFHGVPDVSGTLLNDIQQQLKEIQAIMANNYENIQASLAAERTSLEDIAGDLASQATQIQTLMDQIANGLTAEQAGSVVSQLASIRDRTVAISNIVNPAVAPGEDPPVV